MVDMAIWLKSLKENLVVLKIEFPTLGKLWRTNGTGELHDLDCVDASIFLIRFWERINCSKIMLLFPMFCGWLQIISDYELYYDIITRTERLEKFGKRWTLTHKIQRLPNFPNCFRFSFISLHVPLTILLMFLTEHTTYYNICDLCQEWTGGVFFKSEDAGWWGCGVGVWLCDMCSVVNLCVGVLWMMCEV